MYRYHIIFHTGGFRVMNVLDIILYFSTTPYRYVFSHCTQLPVTKKVRVFHSFIVTILDFPYITVYNKGKKRGHLNNDVFIRRIIETRNV
jgi:hypothetical protein